MLLLPSLHTWMLLSSSSDQISCGVDHSFPFFCAGPRPSGCLFAVALKWTCPPSQPTARLGYARRVTYRTGHVQPNTRVPLYIYEGRRLWRFRRRRWPSPPDESILFVFKWFSLIITPKPWFNKTVRIQFKKYISEYILGFELPSTYSH